VSNATRVYVKVRDLKDPKDELAIALSKFKKKLKETGVITEYLERQHFRRPAVRRKEKAEKALRRNRRSQRRGI
jgi:ribosomal protein S21